MPTPEVSQAAIEPPGKEELGSKLCMECGLCCAGAIHNNAMLEPEEVAGAARLGLPVVPGDRKLFSLPCPALSGTICSIYSDRPAACRRYKCQVLLDLEAGKLQPDQALEKVRTAKRLIREAQEVMPPGMTLPEARRLAIGSVSAEDDGNRKSLDRTEMKLRLQATVLNLFIDRHFRNSRDLKSFVLTPVEESPKGAAE